MRSTTKHRLVLCRQFSAGDKPLQPAPRPPQASGCGDAFEEFRALHGALSRSIRAFDVLKPCPSGLIRAGVGAGSE